MDPSYQPPSQIPQTELPTQPVQPVVTAPPSQPSATPLSGQKSPYDFILDAEHRPKQKLISNKNSLLSRLIPVVLGGLILIIVLIVGSKLLFGSSESNAQILTNLAIEQQEIVRVADLGVKGAKDPSVQALAETTKLSVSSQQTTLISYLKKRNVSLKPADLLTKLNKSTDADLATATANNRFDDEFTKLIKSSLLSYSNDLKKAFNSASNTTSKKILSDSYASTNQLLK